MAILDVSNIISDIEFSDFITFIRRAVTVNENGEVIITETSSTIVACVQGLQGSELERQPQAAILHDTIKVYSKVKLMSEIAGGYADVVVWDNNRYQVKSVVDFVNYGAGYTCATCVMEEGTNE